MKPLLIQQIGKTGRQLISSVKIKTRLALQGAPAATILIALAIYIPMSAQTITTFDAPGAVTGTSQGTYAFNIAPSGTIIGYTREPSNVRHGFLDPRMAVSPSSMRLERARAPGKGRGPTQSTRVERLRDSSLTQSMRSTATFAPIKA